MAEKSARQMLKLCENVDSKNYAGGKNGWLFEFPLYWHFFFQHHDKEKFLMSLPNAEQCLEATRDVQLPAKSFEFGSCMSRLIY